MRALTPLQQPKHAITGVLTAVSRFKRYRADKDTPV